jgi:ferredoxin
MPIYEMSSNNITRAAGSQQYASNCYAIRLFDTDHDDRTDFPSLPMTRPDASMTPQTSAQPLLLTITLEPFGWQFTSDGQSSLLEAARNAGFILPSSCRNGTCRTCLCQLHSGQIRYQIEWPGVSMDEKKEGLILPCVALAVSSLTLFAPAAMAVAAAPLCHLKNGSC